MCLAGLVLITAVNLWGIAESAPVAHMKAATSPAAGGTGANQQCGQRAPG